MFVLRNTTSTLTIQAGSDPGADVPVYVGFEEQIDQQQLRGVGGGAQNPQYQTSKMATGGTTKVTILSAPGAGKRRLARSIFFKNIGAGTVAYTVRFEDSAATVAAVLVMTVSLLTGEVAQYVGGLGWKFFTTAGHVK